MTIRSTLAFQSSAASAAKRSESAEAPCWAQNSLEPTRPTLTDDRYQPDYEEGRTNSKKGALA